MSTVLTDRCEPCITRVRARASEYGIPMTTPQIHLRQLAADTYRRNTLAACGATTANWSDDVQAVTCSRCIAKTELQPA